MIVQSAARPLSSLPTTSMIMGRLFLLIVICFVFLFSFYHLVSFSRSCPGDDMNHVLDLNVYECV